jgi:hypothetical protein
MSTALPAVGCGRRLVATRADQHAVPRAVPLQVDVDGPGAVRFDFGTRAEDPANGPAASLTAATMIRTGSYMAQEGS